MKKGYKKLLIIQSIILLILLINSFFLNILDNYIKIIFLLLVIVILKKNIGIERDNHRYINISISLFYNLLFIRNNNRICKNRELLHNKWNN